MEALEGLLDGPRARGAFLLRTILTPPWAIRLEDRSPLSLIAQVNDEAWLVPEKGDAVRLRPGDIALVKGPDPYVFAHEPAAPVDVIVGEGQQCRTPTGEHVYEIGELGVRTWGNGPGGPENTAVALVGCYERPSEIGGRLLRTLPPILVQREMDCPLVPYLAEEIIKDDPGQEIVLDRVLDLLLISVVRRWFASPEAEAPGWYTALGHPVVGRALRLLHNDPAHPWTVASLAADVGVSRASLGRIFTELVGEPPMSYLTDWRLTLAADLLRDTDLTIGTVAARVGYGSPFALSAAFKRVRGMSPQEYRTRADTTADAMPQQGA